MFNFIQRHRKGIQIGFLVLIVPPFALFGIDSYFRQGEGGQEVARVGDYSISQQEFSQALQDRQRAIQRMAQGGRLDPALLDNPELRYSTLEGLINRRLLIDRAVRGGMAVSDQQLQTMIVELPQFQDEGKFSYTRYEQFLKAEGQSPLMFEARLRQDLILQQLTYGYAETALVPRTVSERLVQLAEQQREVSQYTVAPERYASQVKLEPEAAKKYYEANRGEFEIPEQVRLDYVVHSLESLMAQVKVDPAEVEKFYAANRAQFEKMESQARHILIAVDPGAGPEAKQKARARADDLHRQLTKKPQAFPDVAKQHSQDPGSAAQGGDLGFITRGSVSMKDMPEFEEALFRLKEGEISPPVETRHGFHIIQATEARGVRGKTLDEVRGQIETELKKQGAGRMYAELAEKLSNTVYEQSESLKPAADLARTALRQSGWVTRTRAGEPPLNNPRLLQAVFSEDVLRNKRNTELIEAGPNTLVAARVIEHKPAAVQSYEDVRAAIEKKLVAREAARLAAQEGKAKLELLKAGKPAEVTWSAPQVITRGEHKGLAEQAVRQAFRVGTTTLPAYAEVDNVEGGYTLVKVTRVIDAQNITPEQRQNFTESLRRIVGQEELTAYVTSLKQQAGVRVNKDRLQGSKQ